MSPAGGMICPALTAWRPEKWRRWRLPALDVHLFSSRLWSKARFYAVSGWFRFRPSTSPGRGLGLTAWEVKPGDVMQGDDSDDDDAVQFGAVRPGWSRPGFRLSGAYIYDFFFLKKKCNCINIQFIQLHSIAQMPILRCLRSYFKTIIIDLYNFS